MSLFNSQLKLQRPPKHTIQCHISSIASETDDLPFTQPQQQAIALCSCCHTPRAIDKCVGPKAVAGVAIWHRPKPSQRFEKGAIMYHWARAPFPGKAHEFMTHQDGHRINQTQVTCGVKSTWPTVEMEDLASLALSLLDTSEHLPTTGTHPHCLDWPFLCFGGFLKGSCPWTTLKQRNHASLILLAHATMAVGVGLTPYAIPGSQACSDQIWAHGQLDNQTHAASSVKSTLPTDNWTTKLMQRVASSPLCRPWRWKISCRWHYRY